MKSFAYSKGTRACIVEIGMRCVVVVVVVVVCLK
jgi:hypothetical protein